MSYDKGKTIKEYMQGGYAQPMGYKRGGYMPNIGNQMGEVGMPRMGYSEGGSAAMKKFLFNKKTRDAEDNYNLQAKFLDKAQKMTGILRKGAQIGGTALGGLLATALAPVTGGASLAAGAAVAKGLGSAAGSFFGDKVGGALYNTKNIGKNIGGFTKTKFGDLKNLGNIAATDRAGNVGRALASGITTGITAGGGDALKTFAGKNIPGAGKLFNASKGMQAGDVVDDFGNVVSSTSPLDAGAMGQATQYTDQIMANNPIDMIVGKSNPLDTGGGSQMIAGDILDEYGYIKNSPMNQGGKVAGYEQGGLMKAFKEADINRESIMGATRDRIKAQDESDLLEGFQAEKLAEAYGQTTGALQGLQDSVERDLSFDSMDKMYPEGMEVARTDRFGGQTFSTPEVGMEEEGDDELLNSLLGRTLGANAGGLTSGNIGNILEELAMANQANRNRSNDIINPKRPGVELSYKRRGYAGGGLINMLPFNRRIM